MVYSFIHIQRLWPPKVFVKKKNINVQLSIEIIFIVISSLIVLHHNLPIGL